jgi:large subunit ribosomal protein L21
MNETSQVTPFVVFQTGGKQYRVAPGDSLRIEKIYEEKNEGDSVEFEQVLMSFDGKETKIGAPYIKGAKISAEIVQHGKGKKLNIIRFRSKSNWHRRLGHRQRFTEVKIVKIA